jgi:hypothetical protein
MFQGKKNLFIGKIHSDKNKDSAAAGLCFLLLPGLHLAGSSPDRIQAYLGFIMWSFIRLLLGGLLYSIVLRWTIRFRNFCQEAIEDVASALADFHWARRVQRTDAPNLIIHFSTTPTGAN